MSTASEIKERSTGYFLEREIYPEILNKYSGNFYPEVNESTSIHNCDNVN